jgi:hypothetical protein
MGLIVQPFLLARQNFRPSPVVVIRKYLTSTKRETEAMRFAPSNCLDQGHAGVNSALI